MTDGSKAENGGNVRPRTSPEEDELSKLSRAREADWPSVLFFIHIQLLALFGLWLLFTEAKILTIVLFVTLTTLGITGMTCGAHRLWAHGSYSARTPLKIALAACQTLVGNGTIYDWVKLHRLHHAHFGTDGDPYNHKKGLAYAHIFTHMKALSPYQEKLLKSIDMSDLEADSVIMWQKKLYKWILYPVVFLLLPINAPVEYWGDSLLNAFFVMGFLRYCVVLHAAWLINSAICVWGLQQGDKYPADTNMVFILNKSYWPHYHHLFPSDYKTGEFGTYGQGCSTALIRVFAALGWAYDLRTIETPSIQEALALAVKSNRPIPECLKEVEKKQELPEDHFLLS